MRDPSRLKAAEDNETIVPAQHEPPIGLGHQQRRARQRRVSLCSLG